MRGFLASSIGVTCAAALALPLTLPSSGARAATPAAESAPGALPGSTQSLRLTPLESERALRAGPSREQVLLRREVRPFSLVGVVWDDPDAELHGSVQVRSRASGTGTWSAWQDLETHNHEHAADPDAAERTSGKVRGSTAPLWVGDSDGVEIRVRAEAEKAGSEESRHRAAAPPPEAPLPKGLRLELVDPGAEPPPQGSPADGPRGTPLSAETAAASAVNADLAPLGADVIPALGKKETESDLIAAHGDAEEAGKKARPYIGPRPRIITRKGWGANEALRESDFAYTKSVKAAFVHHTASGNNYRCSQAGSVLRSIYRYHVKSSGWRDFGYNFAVDKCGNIYEGRAGGVAKPVLGAHTLGFNTNSMGVAVLGSFGGSNPPKAAVNAIARLTAWKLGLYGANPRGTTYLTSGGGNLYRKGTNVRLHVISGHRDGFATECPGSRLYKQLGTARSTSARFQGR
ncbi:peptidoglycan recognition protein [Streptomyces sp. MZ04]|uniref:peptidoglycan recognition protein family protein n=1 Tax=Streptomyces sp. MZ04 TaxID=2559236 RepID=UPI001FD814E0|nr:peptidoglycan recognition protein [Streptomyces sp. MZ04]